MARRYCPPGRATSAGRVTARRRRRRGELSAEPPLLDAYGATDPAEFFAVASEAFFERPARLAAEHPALYRELAAFYRIDPRSWS